MDMETTAEAFLNSNFWNISAIFIISYVLFNLVKTLASNLLIFILLKTDNVGLGTQVLYKNSKWEVTKIGFRHMRLKKSEENFSVFVSTSEWKDMWIIVPHEYGEDHSS